MEFKNHILLYEMIQMVELVTVTSEQKKARNIMPAGRCIEASSQNPFILPGSNHLGSVSPGAGGPTMSTSSPGSGGIFLGMEWGGFSPYHLPPTGHKHMDSGELDADLLRLKPPASREQHTPPLPPLLTPE
jgi:hypothetical protein